MSGTPTSDIADALGSACAQMTETVASGSQSAILSEGLLDPGAAICDQRGRVIACDSIDHLGPFSTVARAFVSGTSFPVGNEDVVLLNDPFGGGTRVLDFFAIHPVELGGAGGWWLTISRCTVPDLGGNQFGGYNPTATEVWAEGARITPLRVYERGGWARETLNCVTLNSRTPRLVASQLRALIAAPVTAADLLPEIVAELGADATAVATERLDASAHLAARSLRARSPADGRGSVSVPVRSSGGEERGQVTVSVERAGAGLVVDLSGSAPAAAAYENATRGTAVSAVLSALLGAGEQAALASEGVLETVEVITDPGTIVDAAYPAPTGCAELAVATAVRAAIGATVNGSEPQEVDAGDRILGADGRLEKGLAEELRADESRAKGDQPWQ